MEAAFSPGGGPELEGGVFFGIALGKGGEGGAGGVAEAAEHAGDIAEGGLFLATGLEGLGGLAFEVDDEEVGTGAEELAEMVVAVDANALAEVGGVADEGLGSCG